MCAGLLVTAKDIVEVPHFLLDQFADGLLVLEGQATSVLANEE